MLTIRPPRLPLSDIINSKILKMLFVVELILQTRIVCFAGEETLIMMTKDFDPISEFPCHSEEFGEGT